MVDYTRLAQTAQRLIEKNGRTITFKKRTVDPLDDNKPWRGPDMEFNVTLDAKAVFVAQTGNEVGGTHENDPGTDVARNSDVFLVAALSVADDVLSFTSIIDNTQTWQITKISPLKPGATNLLYVCEVRK